jgi:hypothetical protein
LPNGGVELEGTKHHSFTDKIHINTLTRRGKMQRMGRIGRDARAIHDE